MMRTAILMLTALLLGVGSLRAEHAREFAGIGTDGTEALEMLVHRAGADFTAAGRRHVRLSAATEQSA